MERIGFVGLGTMGASMAANLARAGAPLTVWTETPGRAAALSSLRARSGSPAELRRLGTSYVVCVSDSPDVASVPLRPAGVAEGAAAGSLVLGLLDISAGADRQSAAAWRNGAVGM